MNSTAREPFPVDLLVSDHARREADDALDMAAKKPVTVEKHQAFRESIIARPDDDIEELIQDLRTPSLS
jgi:hypothetical protein